MPATSDRQAALERVYRDARAAGLDDEGARVAVAIAMTEHGYEGAVGDAGVSAGTFQLHHAGGQGNAYAASQGLTPQQSIARLRSDPHAANLWALGGYLGQAIREGQRRGLHGADLATYAQANGQRSVSPERSGGNYRAAFGSDGGGVRYQTMSDTGGTGVDPQQSANPSWDVFDRVVRAKGDPISIRPVDPEVETETDELNFLGEPTGKKVKSKGPNPNPVYRYTFQDGTYVDLQTPGGKPENITIKGGTALTSAARAEAAAPHVVERTVTGPDGTPVKRTFQYDPATNQWTPVQGLPDEPTTRPPTNKTVVTRNGKSYVYDPDTATFTPAAGLPDEAPKRTTHVVGGRAFTLDENGNVLGTADLRTPQQVEKEGIDLTKARQDLLPAAQRILQGHQDTVTYIQGMLERNEITQDQANAYVAASKAAAQSALRGTTPFDEMKEQRTAQQASQRMGIDLLNQRLVSGTSLANSLMSAATGPHVMLRPGQTSLGIDPLAGLSGVVDELQGGPGITPFARSMLMSAQAPPPADALVGLPAGLGPLPAPASAAAATGPLRQPPPAYSFAQGPPLQ